MELVQGLDDAVRDELSRVRAELRDAITDSDYTLEQVATLAGLSRGTLYAILNGGHKTGGGLDTIIRLAFILGVRVGFAEKETIDGSFQVVPLSQSSTSSRISSSRRKAGSRGASGSEVGTRGLRRRDNDSGSVKPAARTRSGQRKGTPRRKGSTGWSRHLASDLRKCDLFEADPALSGRAAA